MRILKFMALGAVVLALAGLAFGTALAAPAKSATGKPGPTIVLEIEGKVVGQFKEISGLESEVEVIEYKDGSDPITHKRAGRATYKNFIVKSDGLVYDLALIDWYKDVLSGKADRKSGSVIYLDREGNEVLRYNFFEAWPCRWKAPELNSGSDTALFEEIEFVVERVERH